jgi:predicted amidohydrolase
MSFERFHAAAIQLDRPHPRDRSEISVAHLLERIDQAVVGYAPFFPVKLIVFPEFAISCPVYERKSDLLDLLAIPADNKHIEALAKKAAERQIWIVTGSFLEADSRWPGAVFNTTLLLGPDGTRMRYRKVHPWLPWEVHTSPADLPGYDEPMFPVADTDLGRIGIATCYDWLFPESTRTLAMNGAEILVRISAYMDPWGATPPMDWWTVVNRCRALENLCAVVACNQGASIANYPPFSWPGGSMIIDHDGRILSQADPGPGEKIVVGPVDLAALRDARATRKGHQMLLHRRPTAYSGPATP